MGWVSAVTERRSLRTWAIIAVVGTLALATVLLVGMRAAQASHYGVSLEGSQFEIENSTPTTVPGANLKLDTPGLTYDWANVNDDRKADEPTGQRDDSFGNGTKEDTAVPSVIDGSIPNNKSDLKDFGVYLERNSSGTFLHMFWRRVQDPSGTTNMDFEFNKSQTLSSNNTTPVRSAGDVLIQYDLAQGGTRPQLFLSRWVTTGSKSQCEAANAVPCWGTRTNLTSSGLATGSINNVAITDVTDGLDSPISARTFGEASVNFSALGTPTDPCTTFGGAYLKSRSSDSFTAATKDFIKPLTKTLSNCGQVDILKTDDANPANPLAGAVFTAYTDAAPTGGSRGPEDTTVAGTCTTIANGTCTIAPLQAGEYWIVETTTPAGYDTAADQHATITAGGTTVPLTFVDARQRGSIVIEKVSNGGTGQFDFTTSTLPGGNFSLTTTTAGTAVSTTYNNLPAGTYGVAETVPSGWDLTSSNCTSTDTTDTSTPANISLSANETVTCTFTNTKKTTTIITAQRFVPQDNATIGGSGTGTFNGQVDFELYKGACDTGELVYYERNVTLPSGGTVSTTNGDVATTNHSAFYAITGSGTYHWKVSYHDDTNGHPNASSCVEESTLTIDNDNTTP